MGGSRLDRGSPAEEFWIERPDVSLGRTNRPLPAAAEMVLLFTADVPWFSIVSVGPLEANVLESERQESKETNRAENKQRVRSAGDGEITA